MRSLLTSARPIIMGVINCSPNSFYGAMTNVDDALRLAEQMVVEGADILDVGGEATNPFVDIAREAPSIQQEIDRVLPVVEAIKQCFPIFVSVDTSEPAVMQAAIAAGADMINDQRALQNDQALAIVAQHDVPVCLMHFFYGRELDSTPLSETLQIIKKELMASVARCQTAGVAANNIIIDPGFGGGNYGLSVDENYYLLAQLEILVSLGYPVLVGWSRKSMIGAVLDKPIKERLYGSIAAALAAVAKGAKIVRVHDVGPTRDALLVWQKIQESING